jgi:hypothetical protein
MHLRYMQDVYRFIPRILFSVLASPVGAVISDRSNTFNSDYTTLSLLIHRLIQAYVISGHHKRFPQSVLSPVFLVRHSMLRRVSDFPKRILRRRLNEQAIASGEQLAPQLPVSGELCDTPSNNHVAFYLIPSRVVKAVYLPAEMLLLFGAVGREDAPLGIRVVEATGFAVHHKLLGAGEGYVFVCAGVVVGAVRVIDERGNLRGANCENGRKPLTKFSIHSIWQMKKDGPFIPGGIFLLGLC